MRSVYMNWFLRLFVGGGFFAAGLLKIIEPAQFAANIGNYRLLPHELVHLVAILLPWVEVVAGVFILSGVWVRPAAMLIWMLTVVFFLAITSALVRGLNIECGCFGTVGGRHIGLVNLAIDLFFMVGATLLVIFVPAPSSKIFSEAGAQNSAPPIEA